MIDKELLESLIRMLDESSLDNMEIERGGTRIRLSKSPDGVAMPTQVAAPLAAPAPPAAGPAVPEAEVDGPPAPASSNLVEVTSPMVGTFYRAPSPEADAYVSTGADVGVGDVLCIIEAMKLMNELESEIAGRVVEICVENAEPVDYGQVLFRVDPA